ncbi:MAG: alpha-galactosidase [Oligoflexales bacterium]|nr:alpha-galactosidase [Oligoflexales bacterium]
MSLALRKTLVIVLFFSSIELKGTTPGWKNGNFFSDYKDGKTLLKISGKNTKVFLTPGILTDRKTVAPTSCSQERSGLICHYQGYGKIKIKKLDTSSFQLIFEADSEFVMEGMTLEGVVQIKGARAFLANGFQSWSKSGVVALPDKFPTREETEEVFSGIRRDSERRGNELSWDFSFVTGEDTSFFIGALEAGRWKPWIQFAKSTSGNALIRVNSGGSGEKVRLQKGDIVQGNVWKIGISSSLEDILEDYAVSLPSRRRLKPANPQIGWNSWYQLYNRVTQDSVLQNAMLAKKFFSTVFDKYGIKMQRPFIVIDDGWEKDWGDWHENEKFPLGLKSLVKTLDSQGIDAGIWIAPLLVSVKSHIAAGNENIFAKGMIYEHISGKYRIVDVTSKDGEQFLRSNIRRLKEAGFKKLKIDFLVAGTFEGQRALNVTGMEAYHLALRIIRDEIGDDLFLLSCGAPSIASFPYVDEWRIGPDISIQFPSLILGPVWVDAVNQARNIAARWFLCSATICDADPVLTHGFLQNIGEVSARGWIASLAGGGLFLSDDLRTLPEKRLSWAFGPQVISNAMTSLPSRPSPIVPENPPSELGNIGVLNRIFNYHKVEVPSVWRTADGHRLLINFNNRKSIDIEGITIPPKSARISNP